MTVRRESLNIESAKITLSERLVHFKTELSPHVVFGYRKVNRAPLTDRIGEHLDKVSLTSSLELIADDLSGPSINRQALLVLRSQKS